MALPCITHGSEIGLARAIELHLVRPPRIPRAESFDTLRAPPPMSWSSFSESSVPKPFFSGRESFDTRTDDLSHIQRRPHHRPMTLRVLLPVGQRIEGRTFPVELPELKGKCFLQLKRAPNEESGAKERWVLSGLGSESTAQADAAINPDGSAVTGQWRLED